MECNFLRLYASATALLLLLIGAANWVIDPLQYYHRAYLPQAFVEDLRYQNPGLARNYDYDSAVIGNSHMLNFLTSEVNARLGWRSLKLAIGAASGFEQRKVIECAIASGKVRRVLWCVDTLAYVGSPDGASKEFPVYMYEDSWQMPFRYLLSKHTVGLSNRVLRSENPRKLDTLGANLNRVYDEHQLLKGWGEYGYYYPGQTSIDHELMRSNIEKNLIAIVLAHPEIDFRLFFPPQPGLEYARDFVAGHSRFQARTEGMRLIVGRLGSLPNCRVHDFQSIPRYVNDTNLYMDLTHFSPEVISEILDAVSKDKHRITPDNCDAAIASLQREVRLFLVSSCDSEHPTYGKLRLSTIPALAQWLQREEAVALQQKDEPRSPR